MGSVTFNAPSNWGWASGSAFYAGMVYGFTVQQLASTRCNDGTQGGNQANYYAGCDVEQPMEGRHLWCGL